MYCPLKVSNFSGALRKASLSFYALMALRY